MRRDHYNFAAVADFLQIKVEKTLTFFEIHGQGVEEEPKGVLQINNRTGEMTVHRTVDFEAYKEIKVGRWVVG